MLSSRNLSSPAHKSINTTVSYNSQIGGCPNLSHVRVSLFCGGSIFGLHVTQECCRYLALDHFVCGSILAVAVHWEECCENCGQDGERWEGARVQPADTSSLLKFLQTFKLGYFMCVLYSKYISTNTTAQKPSFFEETNEYLEMCWTSFSIYLYWHTLAVRAPVWAGERFSGGVCSCWRTSTKGTARSEPIVTVGESCLGRVWLDRLLNW